MTGRRAYPIVFLTGFAGMSAELFGIRLLVPHYGSSIYVIGAIISVFLAGLSAGYFWGGHLAVRTESAGSLRRMLAAAAVTLAVLPCIGVPATGILAGIITGPRAGALLTSAILFFPPCVILGAILPLTVRRLEIYTALPAAKAAGNIYAASTLGSIAGTLFTSFWLIGWVGTFTGLILCGAIMGVAWVLDITGKIRLPERRG